MSDSNSHWGKDSGKTAQHQRCAARFSPTLISLGVSFLILVTLMLLALLILSFELAGSKLPEKKQRVLPEVVQLSLGKTQLYVPSKYLKGRKVGNNHLGQAIHINLWALLPDFDWYEPSRNQYEFVEVLSKGRRVQIRLEDREGVLPLHKFFKEHPSYQKYTYFLESQYDELKYGLELYNNHHPRSEWYWLRNQDGEPILRGRCSKDGVVPYPGCELMWELSNDVRVSVDFGKEYLSHWKLIYNQVNRLLRPMPTFGVISDSALNGG